MTLTPRPHRRGVLLRLTPVTSSRILRCMEYLSLDAAATALNLSRTQVRRLLAAGILVGTRHGGNRRGVWLIEAASVEAEQRRRQEQCADLTARSSSIA